MIEELIKKTNTDEFYHGWNLCLESFNGKIASFERNNLEINLILKNEIEEEGKDERWTIFCEQAYEMKNIFAPIYLPYIKVALLEDHPLLWKFKHDIIEGELISTLEKYDEFINKLHWLYDEYMGRFLKWDRDLYGIQKLIEGEKSVPIVINMKTYNNISGLLDEFGFEIRIEQIQSGEDKGIYNNPEMKLLIFGNTDVSPHDYNLGQPYIIAEKIEAKLR